MSIQQTFVISIAILVAVGILVAVVILYMNLAITILNEGKNQSIENGNFLVIVNKTLIEGQGKANIRGNATLNAIAALLTEVLDVSKQNAATEHNVIGNLSSHRIIANLTYDKIFNISDTIEANAKKSLQNQEQFFFPWQNETFQKLFKALNITDTGTNFTLP